MNKEDEIQTQKKLPFNNLYLISGLVHGFNKLWMYIFTIVLIVFSYFGFQLVSFYPLGQRLQNNGYSSTEIAKNPSLMLDSVALGIDRNYIFLAELGIFVFAFAGLYAGIRFVHGKSLTSVLTGYERFRFGRFFYAFIIWGILVVGSTLIQYLTEPGNFELHINISGLLFSVLISVLLIPVQSSFEEILFRGYLLQGMAQLFRSGIIPLLITSLLFGLAHMANPEVAEYGWPVMLSYYCSFAFFMGGITLLDEGLELAMGIHAANNVVSSILVSNPNSVLKNYSIFESNKTNAITEVLLWFIAAAITFAIFWYKYRWKNYKLILK